MKECRICHEVKNYSEFRHYARSKDGHQAECKSCTNLYPSNSYQAKHENHLKRAYNITPDQKLIMFEHQQHKCYLCHWLAPTVGDLHVDHDHDTNEVRGLLCHGCNVVLGHCGDDPDKMLRIASRARGYIRNTPFQILFGSLLTADLTA